jgi:hypothetical protein
MIHFEQVPFFVHLNPISFGAWFARFDDKPFQGPYRSQAEAQAAVIESLNEGQLALYFTKLRQAEIAAINSAIKATVESLVPFKVEHEKPKPLTADDVRDHKPPFKSFKPWDDDNGAMAKLPTPKPKLPPSGNKVQPQKPMSIVKPRVKVPALDAIPF